MTSTLKLNLSTVVALFAVLAFASTAMAQPQREGYNALGGQTQAEVQGDTGVGPAGTDTGGGSDSGSQPVSASANDGAGSLPFTGLDVALLALAGGLLATVGLGMRRLVRSSDVA